jgi:hypothetical protein
MPVARVRHGLGFQGAIWKPAVFGVNDEESEEGIVALFRCGTEGAGWNAGLVLAEIKQTG